MLAAEPKSRRSGVVRPQGLVCEISKLREGWFFSIQITIYTGVRQACCAMVWNLGRGALRGRAGTRTRQWVLGRT